MNRTDPVERRRLAIMRQASGQTNPFSIGGLRKRGHHAPRPITLAQPARKPPDPDTELAICTVCGKTWREAEDCKTPADCNFVRETKP